MIYDIILNIEKSGIKPRVKVSQYDKTLPQIRATLYSNNQPFNVPSGSTVYICGTKKDNTGFKYECTYSNNVVTADITEQMTAFSGDVEVEFTIESSGSRKGTENFILEVEPTALADDVVISETDIPAIQRLSQPATTTQLGVIKVDGTSVTIDADGTLHSSASGTGTVKKVNGQSPDASGEVTVTADNIIQTLDNGFVSASEKQTWNAKSNFSGSYNDLTNKPTIPDELADLTDDSTHRLVTDTEKQAWNGKSTVSVTQKTSSGTNIADITINGNTTKIYAPTSGGGGATQLSQLDDVLISSATDGQLLGYDSSTSKWKNVNAPSGGGDMLASTYDPNGDVANAGGIPSYVSAHSVSIPSNVSTELGACSTLYAVWEYCVNHRYDELVAYVGSSQSTAIKSVLPLPSEVTAQYETLRFSVDSAINTTPVSNSFATSITCYLYSNGNTKAYIGHIVKYQATANGGVMFTGWERYEDKGTTSPNIVGNVNDYIATTEDGTTSSKAYAIGDYFIRGGKYKKCIQPIAQGGTFTVGTNCVDTDIGSELVSKVGKEYGFGATEGILLGSSDNLNNIRTCGCYRWASAVSGTPTNAPTAYNSIMFVIGGYGSIGQAQIVFTRQSYGFAYWRVDVGASGSNVWSDWVNISTVNSVTQNSLRPITSGAVYTALGNKQDTLTFTSTPSASNKVVALQDLSIVNCQDTQISSPTSGQVLKYNGSAWVNDSGGGGSTTTGTFTAASGISGNVSVKQYGNVVNIYGYVYALNGSITADTHLDIGYISGVSLRTTQTNCITNSHLATTCGDSSEVSLDGTNGLLVLIPKATRYNGWGCFIDITYIV